MFSYNALHYPDSGTPTRFAHQATDMPRKISQVRGKAFPVNRVGRSCPIGELALLADGRARLRTPSGERPNRALAALRASTGDGVTA
jgi:hypothetical protein